MNHVVPPSLLFDFCLPVPRCTSPSAKTKGRLFDLPDESSLFVPAQMNERPAFADIKLAWNEDGLALVVSVSGKSAPTAGDADDIKYSDGILIWLDTRPSGSIHRATEYCHHLAFLPVDDQVDGKPSAHVQPIAQQRAHRTDTDVRRITCRTHLAKDGYEMEAWIPGTQLSGYREIAEIGRIGFYCVVQDTELGHQHLSVGDDFPYAFDPSVWLQLELES